MNTDLDQLLFQKTEIEQQQEIKNRFILDLPKETIDLTANVMHLENKFFFRNKDIFINKHNRFAPYPLHSHQFLEINYMYAGHCVQYINGEKYTVNTGDIILLDRGSEHAIETLGEQDILINILFRSQDIHVDLLNKIRTSQSILFDFLLSASSGTFNETNFLLFRKNDWGESQEIFQILNTILNEYYFPRSFSNQLISSYLPVLFIMMARNYQKTLITTKRKRYQDPVIIKVLDEIEENYKSITLNEIAQKLNYNKYYLSNLIKKRSGSTFTELVNRQKLLQAHMLITSTNLSIAEIIDTVGFTNKSYFYKKFKETYNLLPKEARNQNV